MAWDVAGVFRFLDRSVVDQYEVIIYSSFLINLHKERQIDNV
jgi:hypothetical protein